MTDFEVLVALPSAKDAGITLRMRLFSRSRRLILLILMLMVGIRHSVAQVRPHPTVFGTAQTIASLVTAPDGTQYDLILLTGTLAEVRPATNRAARVQFIDPNDDIVTVQITGDATVIFTFESALFPTQPAKYNITGAAYTKGLASLGVGGADATTTLRIWTTGRANTVNPQIFRDGTDYDGIADLKSIHIAAVTSGAFGTLDASNVRFTGSSGVVGIQASNVQFAEPVSLHDIDARDNAAPSLAFGSVSEIRVVGGDLFQSNGRAVRIRGFPLLNLIAGANSHGVVLPQQSIAGAIEFSEPGIAQNPVTASPLRATFAANVGGSHLIAAFGSTPGSFAVTGGDFPPWASLNAATGVISGTPSSTFGSPFAFDVTMTAGVNSYVGRVTLTVTGPPAVAPSFTHHPASTTLSIGSNATLSAAASGTPDPTYEWRRNGTVLSQAHTSTLQLTNVTPAQAGLYTVIATNDAGTAESAAAFVGIRSEQKVAGIAEELASNIQHPNGNIFDQILLKGAHASIKAEPGKITRMSFTDPDHDIVQLEFSGAGTVSLWLEDATPPARPLNYNQQIDYVGGHARLVITDADASSHLSVFTVGTANAVNKTLFLDGVVYDGVADIVSISISSVDGKFGGLRAANAAFVGTEGVVGIYAPNVAFGGPVFVGDIAASGAANPVLVLGSASDVRITGGDLLQPNDRPVAIKGVPALQFRNGSTSHGDIFPAQLNRARLERDGVDVTAQVAQPPQP